MVSVLRGFCFLSAGVSKLKTQLRLPSMVALEKSNEAKALRQQTLPWLP